MKAKAAHPRHDPALARMAQRLMRMPFNRSGTDKSWVLGSQYYWRVFWLGVKRA
ncbi:MAG TPA: hypothetical protein VNK24_07875 [Elusimicrobiota bacterium]|nr:hypothetical protein [Elusimicrobiota bacterium]